MAVAIKVSNKEYAVKKNGVHVANIIKVNRAYKMIALDGELITTSTSLKSILKRGDIYL